MKKSANKTTTISIEKEVNLKKYYYFLGFLVFVLFANTIGNGYNMDDELVTMNHKMTSRGLEAIIDIFTSPYYSDDMGYAYGYRPIVHLSFALEHQLFGEKAGISHLINVLLFAFSVVLFFKLLLKWVGEQNRWMALVIAVLFAVHPIHTEAVASIKNRDEILAFFFVALSGLYFFRFATLSSWSSLIWVFVFFSLAMLSKKSVFPMVIILPLASILMQNVTWKKILFATVALVIPAALIASELVFSKIILFSILPLAGVLGVFFLIQEVKKPMFSWKNLFLNPFIWSGFSIILTFYAIYTANLLVVPIALLIAATVYFLDQTTGLIVFSVIGVSIGMKFDYMELRYVVLLLLLFSLFSKILIKQKIPSWLIILVVLTILTILIDDLELGPIGSIFVIACFAFLLVKMQLFALIFALIVLSISGYLKFEKIYFAILLLLFWVFQVMDQKRNRVYFVKLFPFVFGIILIFSPRFISDYQLSYRLKIPSAQVHSAYQFKTTVAASNQSVLKEGRMLEFAENTLVKPHTSQETIGTGFSVLGEYFRLMIFPVELSFYYGYSKIDTVGLNAIWVWFALITHLGLVVLAISQLRKRPIIALGSVWYLLCIILFSNWVELVAGMVGERLAFTASAGFCMLLGGIIFWIKPSFSIQKPTWIEWTVLGVVILFGFKTIQRNSQWKDALTLMSHDIQHLGNSAQANNLLALRLMQTSIENPDLTPEQRLEMQNRAIVHFDRAISIWPDFMNANFDKGRAAQVIGNHVKAIEGFQEAIRIDSTFHQAYFNLLTSYDQLGQTKQYLQTAKNLFKQNQDPAVYEYLARGYFLNQQKDSSSWILQEGIKKYPTVESLKVNLQELQNLR